MHVAVVSVSSGLEFNLTHSKLDAIDIALQEREFASVFSRHPVCGASNKWIVGFENRGRE